MWSILRFITVQTSWCSVVFWNKYPPSKLFEIIPLIVRKSCNNLRLKKQLRIFISQKQYKRLIHGLVWWKILYMGNRTNFLVSHFWQSINTKSMGTWWNIGPVVWLSRHYKNGSLRNTSEWEILTGQNVAKNKHATMIIANFYISII